MRLFKVPFLLLTTLLISLNCTTLLAQEYPNCLLDGDFDENIIVGISGPVACDDNDFEDFAAMSTQELYNYLIPTEDYDCFSRKVFFYRENYSEQLFEEEKINYLADQAAVLANNFNGSNNGINGIFQYFTVAVTQNYDYGLHISATSWAKIKNACIALSSNSHIQNANTYDANMISGYLFATCWANNISGQTAIMDLVQHTLYQHAELQNWKNFIDYNDNSYDYEYYFKMAYFLDVFLFYAIRDRKEVQNPKFYHRLNENPYYQIITSLAYAACDPELLNLNIPRIRESALECADALSILGKETSYDENRTLYNNYVEQALLELLDCYEYLHPVWIETIEILTRNDTDTGYELETVKTELKDREFPNQNTFEDGRLIIYSSLPDIEILGLYEALQQVKAQFFRLFELNDQMPVENDPNETVQLRIYKDRESYRYYNGILFNAPSPGGGVYIESTAGLNEDYATMYTWDRESHESSYSLEELVRHEYIHYLQGRYLIKGMWGDRANPFYENERLIWFEEGMAEFFSGSTAMDGIIDRDVIKSRIQNRPAISLEKATKSGYTSNTYNFGNVIWSNWYNTNRKRFKDLANFTRNGTSYIDDFDAYLENAVISDDQDFQGHINCLTQDVCETWTPSTQATDYNLFNTSDIASLNNEFIIQIDNIESTQIEEQYSAQVGRFHLSGDYTVSAGSNTQETKLNLYNRLDEILIELKNNSNFNNFDYATAYYGDVNVSSNPPSAQFHIVGPLKKVSKAVYPGDVNYDGIVNALDIMHIGHYFNESNNSQNNPDINWQPFQREDWNTNQTSIYCYYGYEDLKHADCNGDGIINLTDLDAIEQNWLSNHFEAPFIQPIIPCFFFDDFTDYQLSIQPIEILNNNNILINISIERISNSPIDFFSGFINTTYSDNVSSISINFDESWIGNPNVDFEYLTNENILNRTLETGFTKTNGLNSNGNGVVAQIELQLANNNNTNIELYVELGFQNIEKDNFFLQRNYEIHPNFGVQGINNSICDGNLTINESTIFQNQYNSIGSIVTSGNITVGKEQVVEYKANRVRLNTGFSVNVGASFNASYDSCQ